MNGADGAPVPGVTTHLGIDADDTLWHSENRFVEVHQRFHDLVRAHVDCSYEELEARMLETEQRNLRLFGYGVKGFVLSLIETAIEITDGAVDATAVGTLLDFGKELLDHPVEVFEGVADALTELRDGGFRLVVVTKGDLWHQESKIAASGLADLFDAVEIVGEKDVVTYSSVLARHAIEPQRFCMVGNSLRSDVIPALRAGARAVHVPYTHLWAHEVPDPAVVAALPPFLTLRHFRDLVPLLAGGGRAGSTDGGHAQTPT